MDLADVYLGIEEDPFWDGLRLPGVKLVRGYGATRPKVMLVGEAPGAQENSRGRPFVGRSGQVLNALMALADIRLDDSKDQYADDGHGSTGMLHDEDPELWQANAFITNVVKYRPPQNRTPTLREQLHAREALRDEWRALGKPKVIVCIGSTAHTTLHPCGHDSVSNWAGQVPYMKEVNSRRVYFSSQFHPAYALRKGPRVQRLCEVDWTELGDWLRKEGIL